MVILLQVVAETQFLVTPLSQYGGKPITPGEAQQLHKGPTQKKGQNKPNPVLYTYWYKKI